VGINLLFLSKNHINYVLKSPVSNCCRLITPQIQLGLIMAGVWPLEILIV